jgi:hypothetical protein
VLYIGRHARTAHVRPYDLDGRPLGGGFSFRGVEGGRAAVRGIAVDSDLRCWIADDAARGVRSFTQFGRELTGIISKTPGDSDLPGHLAFVTDVAVSGVEAGERVFVASSGYRRHALHRYSRDGELIASLRPMGDPLGQFRGLVGVALLGPLAYACDSVAACVQVYRDDEFHFAFGIDSSIPSRTRSVPRALAPLSNGWVVIAHGDDQTGGIIVADGGGRLVRTLAPHGTDGGQVFAPTDVAVHENGTERDTLVAVIDRDAERVQVFTLDGRCLGEIVELPGLGESTNARPHRTRAPRRQADD